MNESSLLLTLAVISPMVGDVQARLNELITVKKGVINPFEEVYRVVWQLTMRTVGPHDVVEDRKLLETTLKYMEMLDESTDVLGLCFLWLPTPARIKQYYAGLRLYLIYQGIMSKRIKTRERKADALQVMIDQGDSPKIVIPTIIGALFAGQFNSGLMSVWSLIHMAEQPKLLERARAEILEACRQYDTDLTGLPLDAWEKSFPFLDNVLRETIRLHMYVISFRKQCGNLAREPIRVLVLLPHD
jgi:cytochrome P450